MNKELQTALNKVPEMVLLAGLAGGLVWMHDADSERRTAAMSALTRVVRQQNEIALLRVFINDPEQRARALDVMEQTLALRKKGCVAESMGDGALVVEMDTTGPILVRVRGHPFHNLTGTHNYALPVAKYFFHDGAQEVVPGPGFNRLLSFC